MAIVHGYFDESGKHSDHPVVALAGVCGTDSRIQAFDEEWRSLLRQAGLASLHMIKVLKHKQFSPNIPAKTPLERTEALKPFADCINNHLELGLIQAFDVKGFQSLTKKARAGLGNLDDPFYVAFARGAAAVLEFTHPDDKISIICDDDEETALDCYKQYRRFRRLPVVHKKLIAITFADDDYFPALQAADMVVYLTRLQAKQMWYGDPYEYRELLNYICKQRPNGMRWKVTFADEKRLLALSTDANWLKHYGKHPVTASTT